MRIFPHRTLRPILFILFTLAIVCPSVAEDTLGPAFFSGRRAALAAEHPDAVIIVRAAEENTRCSEFQQGADFWYLTGVELPDAVLVLAPSRQVECLFVNPSEGWEFSATGLVAKKGESGAKEYGVARVEGLERLGAVLDELLAGEAPPEVLTPLAPEEVGMQNADTMGNVDNARKESPWDGRPSRAQAFRQALEKRFPKVSVKDLQPTLSRLRMVKTPEEIERMRIACRITCEGICEAMSQTRPGLAEYQIQAVAEFVYRLRGATRLAFGTIAGSGPNSTILHYASNRRTTDGDDVIVLDTGCEYGYYASDVTRTFPVSGHYTPRQREIYEIVLRAQKAGLEAARPGATIREIDRAARRVIQEAGYGDYFIHGTCHFVGLAVHDVGAGDRKLKPGMVLTVEPGIYLPKEEIGIRIEDSIVITADGHEVLSAGVPKAVEEVEALVGSKAGK